MTASAGEIEGPVDDNVALGEPIDRSTDKITGKPRRGATGDGDGREVVSVVGARRIIGRIEINQTRVGRKCQDSVCSRGTAAECPWLRGRAACAPNHNGNQNNVSHVSS